MNTIMNSLSYTGIVSISQYKNGKKTLIKKIKNSGGRALFNFFTDCLIGDFGSAKVTRPTKLMLLKATDDKDDPTQKPTLVSKSFYLYLRTPPEKTVSSSYPNYSSSVTYSFTIPSDLLEEDFNSIGLYSDNTSDIYDYAAICDYHVDSGTITPSSVIIIDWQLVVSNHNPSVII